LGKDSLEEIIGLGNLNILQLILREEKKQTQLLESLVNKIGNR
jgi:hypothetical protein